MHLLAPGKINLSLKILGKRPDGYHELETLMVPLSLADEIQLTIRASGGITLSINDPTLSSGRDNLVHRAATLFEQMIGHSLHVHIDLQKKIPHGAGLGGGSSDAAAILLGLNRHFGHPFEQQQLVDMGSKLGADVPFFLFGSAAWCRGIGEKVEVTQIQNAPLSLLIVKPPFPIPTAWAFQHRNYLQNQTKHFITEQAPQQFGDIILINDLEPVVFQKYALLPVLKKWLLNQPEVCTAMMSGSGSTIFCILDSLQSPIHSLTDRIVEAFGNTMWIHYCNTL